ncbi:MAG: DUF2752 domain-containing protein [Pirellulales bacterium]|nr:DUF2752 domain-containing protein [Pirellulales bacterium]
MNDQVLDAEIIVLDDWPVPRTGATDEADAARTRAGRRRHHRNMLWISCAVVVLSCWFEVQPGGRIAFWGLEEYPLPQTCMSRSLFGVDCPGCGLTRSFVHLAHGRWQESLAVHRVGWLLVVAVLLQFPYRMLGLRHSDGWPLGRRIPVWFGRMLIFALIANWLIGLAWHLPGH